METTRTRSLFDLFHGSHHKWLHVFIGPPTVHQLASPVQEERLSEEVPGASACTYVGGALGKDQEDSSEVRSELKRKMSDLDSQQGIYIITLFHSSFNLVPKVPHLPASCTKSGRKDDRPWEWAFFFSFGFHYKGKQESNIFLREFSLFSKFMQTFKWEKKNSDTQIMQTHQCVPLCPH